MRADKGLCNVEQAFRCLKSVDPKIRPLHHRRPDRVRAHLFLCLLAYYVEWHLRVCMNEKVTRLQLWQVTRDRRVSSYAADALW